jgi:hypothetical protein
MTSTAVQAAPLPAPVQVFLQQIKGEWIVLDGATLSTRLTLQADGRGQLQNRDGSSDIRWRLEGKALRIELQDPTTTQAMEYEDDQEFRSVTALQSLTLEFKKFEGLGTIVWKMTSHSQVSYPEHSEKPVKDLSSVSESSKLLAARQMKAFKPQEGQILTLALPDYSYTDAMGDIQATVSVLARLDAANVLTLLRGQEVGQTSLFWTIDNGSLRVSDGKGYTVRYKLYKGDEVSSQLLVEVQRADRQFIADQSAIHTDEKLRAQGFRADSPIFQGCWNAFDVQTRYCFQADRIFTFTTQYPGEDVQQSSYGLWRIENGRIIVDRYRDADGFPIMDPEAIFQCEKELAAANPEASCTLSQTRSYELINQNEDTIGVYRILKQSDFAAYDAHVFTRAR